MSKKQALRDFYVRWDRKASEYHDLNLSEYFDKFFSQFVIFNRLYVEVAKILIKEDPGIDREFRISKRIANATKDKKVVTRQKLPPDRWCATSGIQIYCRQTQMKELIFDKGNAYLKTIESIIQNRDLYFHEDYLTNTPLWDKDLEMCNRIRDKNLYAVFEFIYVVRCNLFHGEKEFSQAQHPLFQSLNSLLSIINQQVFDTLMSDDRF